MTTILKDICQWRGCGQCVGCCSLQVIQIHEAWKRKLQQNKFQLWHVFLDGGLYFSEECLLRETDDPWTENLSDTNWNYRVQTVYRQMRGHAHSKWIHALRPAFSVSDFWVVLNLPPLPILRVDFTACLPTRVSAVHITPDVLDRVLC